MFMSSRKVPSYVVARAQRGVVLVVALIFLVLLTIIAISASGRSLLQERMAGGLRNAQLAQMSAETALRGAEWTLWTSTVNSGTQLNCGTGLLSGNCYRYDPASTLYAANGIVSNFRNSSGWVDTGAAIYKGPSGNTDYTASSNNNKLAKNPVYIIEDLGVELPPNVTGSLHESGATGSGGTGYASTNRHIYRITARGAGANGNTVRVLESTFAAKSN